MDEEDDEETAMVATEMALMAFSDSEVQTNESFSKSCKALKECDILREIFEKERIELTDLKYNLANHKRGISILEKQLVHYQYNETKFNDEIVVLKRDLDFKVAVIEELKKEIDRLKKVNENVKVSVNTLEYCSKM